MPTPASATSRSGTTRRGAARATGSPAPGRSSRTRISGSGWKAASLASATRSSRSLGWRSATAGEARSATLPLPPAVGRLIDSGLELGDANDRVFATLRSKEQGGAFGLLTGGRHTRESVYAQTVLLALVPLVHPLFTDDAPSPAGAGGQR